MATSNIPSSAADAGAAIPPPVEHTPNHKQTLEKIGKALDDEDVLTLRKLLEEDHTGFLLGEAFCFYITENLSFSWLANPGEAIKKILEQVPADGEWGLGRILIESIKVSAGEAIEAIEKLPNFALINPNRLFGLADAWMTCIKHQLIPGGDDIDIFYINLIFNHPRVNNIALSADQLKLARKNFMGLVKSETYASHKVLFLYLDSTKVNFLTANGIYGLGRALVHTAYEGELTLVRKILEHPLAQKITSEKTEITNKTGIEKGYGVNRFGLKEALFAATNTTKGSEQNRIQVVRDILQAMEAHTEEVDPNAPFSIAEALGEAGRNNPDAVPILLNSPLSQEIRVEESQEKKEYGGLSPTLLGAAERGHLAAVEAVLRHPKAYEISPEDYNEAISEAAKNGHDNIVDLIREYHVPTKPAAAKPAAAADNKPPPAKKE